MSRGGDASVIAGEPPRDGYVYVVGEREEPAGPVKIGMTYVAGSKAGRAGLSEGNWRTLYAEHTAVVPWPELRWFEWRVHQALMPWHKRGEWFDVRHLKDEFGGWDGLLAAAIEGRVSGAGSCVVEAGDHRLLVMSRHWPARPIQFTARCSCGEEIVGAAGQAFITVVRQFENAHLGVPSTRRGSNRRSGSAAAALPRDG